MLVTVVELNCFTAIETSIERIDRFMIIIIIFYLKCPEYYYVIQNQIILF